MQYVWEQLGELLPLGIKNTLRTIPDEIHDRAEEIRLRRAYPPCALFPEGERSLGTSEVSENDIAFVLDRASRSSLHSVQGELRQGFISAGRGIRIGVCGSVSSSGGIESFRDVSSLAIRIPHEVRGVGGEVMERLFPFESSVLIISPPGGGKTTFLRELIRRASTSGKRVSLCDERGEVAAMWRGRAGFDLGPHTDVLSGADKARGIIMLLRSMNPQIIALDEISAAGDAEALEQAAYCGAAIFATAHGGNIHELRKRPHYRRLLDGGVFEKAVIISGRERRRYELVDI